MHMCVLLCRYGVAGDCLGGHTALRLRNEARAHLGMPDLFWSTEVQEDAQVRLQCMCICLLRM